MFDLFTRSIANGYRSLGARHPTLIGVGVGLGLLVHLIIHALAAQYDVKMFQALDETSWYVYVAIALGFLLIPSLMGRSRAPDAVVEEIAAVKKIMEEANMPESKRAYYWSSLLGKFIANTTIGGDLPPPSSQAHGSDEAVKVRK